MKETRIPTRADQPPQLLLWSADECLPVLLGLGLGIMINQVFVCTVTGMICRSSATLTAVAKLFSHLPVNSLPSSR